MEVFYESVVYLLTYVSTEALLLIMEYPVQWRSLLLYQFTKRVIKLTVIIIVGYHCYQLGIITEVEQNW
jgi:hypothetical protein